MFSRDTNRLRPHINFGSLLTTGGGQIAKSDDQETGVHIKLSLVYEKNARFELNQIAGQYQQAKLGIVIIRVRNRIMKKRSDKNSATSAVVGFVGAINDRIPLPAGVELRSEAELII